MQDIELEKNEKIIIFGDIHGQFPDFISVVEKEGYPSNELKYVKALFDFKKIIFLVI